MSQDFYITTAIDYPNGNPHIGHAYEKIISDSYNRWYQLMGYQTHFMTGTDENGQKLIDTAKKSQKEIKTFIDEKVILFKDLCLKINVKYDEFVRTSEERHAKKCAEIWKKLEEKDLIYKGNYSGNYCISCETFYTELQAPDLICPTHHLPLEKKEEEGFFFKLSSLESWAINYIKKHPSFITPKSKYNETLSRLENDTLRDLAISRPSEGWGIPVPNKQNFVMYTWFDALLSYYSSLEEDKSHFWPANLHVIGKDILWFHSVILPCLLKACDLPISRQIYVHGMILDQSGKKMSKSLNNIIDPLDLLKKYPVDTFRYYMLRNISSNSDGKFSESELITKNNSELANDYGNLIMRVLKLAIKNLPPLEVDAKDISQEINIEEYFKNANKYMERREHNKALDSIWEFINSLNQYVNDKAPWKYKADPQSFKQIIYNCLYGIGAANYLLQAFLPETSEKVFSYINPNVKGKELLTFGGTTYNLKNPEILFPKIENLN